MGSDSADQILGGDTVEASEATIEIKIKTLDSQTYTLRVDKQMPVPALKEQIASVTGVLSDQQRLICRGRVLKDDQLLSAYHVEDGHTLHMVVRQPISPSSESLLNYPETDPSSTSRHTHQIAPGVVIETFSLPVQGDGAPPPEISRILSAVLGSMGLSGLGSGGSEGMVTRDNSSQRPERTSGMFESLNFPLEQTSSMVSSNRPLGTFGHSAGFSMGSLQPPVIPDSLTTMTQYLSNLRREFVSIEREVTSGGQAGVSPVAFEDRNSQSEEAETRQGFPTPASLAEVITSARHLLADHASEALLQLEEQFERQENVTDPSTRSSTQAIAMRTGALVHNMGSFFLELGRTIMTLRMGQTPSEAVVNAGPAVFISPTGPNPIMVQALPFQVGSSIGSVPMGAVQSGSGLTGPGTGYIPRRIDIQIRRGSSTVAATANANATPATSSGNSEIPANQGALRASDVPGESGVRVVPLRTMVASVPGSFGRLSPDSLNNNSMGALYYPVLGRFQQVATGNANGERGPQASESQQRPVGDPTRDGLSQRQNEQTANGRSVSINILSAGASQNGSESERQQQVPGGVLQLLRSLFPGGEVQVEDEGGSDAASIVASLQPSRTEETMIEAGGEDSEPRPSEDGIFLSNMLRQFMPLIPGAELGNASENGTPAQESTNQAESSNAGTSRRPDDSESSSPNSKRRKVE